VFPSSIDFSSSISQDSEHPANVGSVAISDSKASGIHANDGVHSNLKEMSLESVTFAPARTTKLTSETTRIM
jgi:hypothetical protein